MVERGFSKMAHEPVDKIGDRRRTTAAAAALVSPFGTDRYDRTQVRSTGGANAGDRLTLSGAASSRIDPINAMQASDTAHLGVHGRDLASIARGEVSYESWLAQQN